MEIEFNNLKNEIWLIMNEIFVNYKIFCISIFMYILLI